MPQHGVVTTDPYAWYRAALKGDYGPVSDGKPECGYYRMREGRDGPWRPVAIWMKDGTIVCRVAGEMRDPVKLWSWCAKNPVTSEAAKFAFQNGYWPDEPAQLPQRANMPADPFEALRAEMEDRGAQAEAWLKAHPQITTQQDCDIARNMQAQLLKLNKTADQTRDTQKRPHLEASRAVDAKFKPLIAITATWAARLRTAFEAFLRAEEKRLQVEARRKYEAERAAAEAERKRLEQQRARKLRDDPAAALTEKAPLLPELPVAPETVKVQAGGGFGRKAGLKSVWVATMVDYAAALAHFADNDKVRELIEKLGQRAIKDGARKVPGFVIKEERRAA